MSENVALLQAKFSVKTIGFQWMLRNACGVTMKSNGDPFIMPTWRWGHMAVVYTQRWHCCMWFGWAMGSSGALSPADPREPLIWAMSSNITSSPMKMLSGLCWSHLSRMAPECCFQAWFYFEAIEMNGFFIYNFPFHEKHYCSMVSYERGCPILIAPYILKFPWNKISGFLSSLKSQSWSQRPKKNCSPLMPSRCCAVHPEMGSVIPER